MAVGLHAVVPPDRLAAVLESLPDLPQLLAREPAVGEVAPLVLLGIGVLRAELVTREPARVALDLLRPLAAGGLVEHVLRRLVVIHPHPVAEPPAEQRRR